MLSTHDEVKTFPSQSVQYSEVILERRPGAVRSAVLVFIVDVMVGSASRAVRRGPCVRLFVCVCSPECRRAVSYGLCYLPNGWRSVWMNGRRVEYMNTSAADVFGVVWWCFGPCSIH